MVLQDLIDSNPVPVKEVPLSEYAIVVRDASGQVYDVDSLTFEYDNDGEKRLMLFI
jgi:hypothetical protein